MSERKDALKRLLPLTALASMLLVACAGDVTGADARTGEEETRAPGTPTGDDSSDGSPGDDGSSQTGSPAPVASPEPHDERPSTPTVPTWSPSTLHFADAAEAATLLSTEDDFTRSMSVFDRSVRLQVAREVSVPEYLSFVKSAARGWSASERQQVTALFEQIRPRLEAMRAPLPPTVTFVQTDGSEEGGAPYTRASYVVFPNTPDRALLIHELFHLMSRHHPVLRDRLYARIGFEKTGRLDVGALGTFADRLITNPDAPINSHFIRVRRQGQPLDVMPLVYSNVRLWNGGDIFSHLNFNLIEVTDSPGGKVPRLNGGAPVLHDVGSLEGFYEQIGRNTSYIVHPEEILADHFVFVVDPAAGTPATPALVEDLRRIITEYTSPPTP